MEAIECSSSLSVIQRKIPSCSLSIHVWQSKCDKITKFKLKCAKCKLKGANGLNCKLNGEKYRGHGSCKISILLYSTSPFQNLYPQLLHP